MHVSSLQSLVLRWLALKLTFTEPWWRWFQLEQLGDEPVFTTMSDGLSEACQVRNQIFPL